MYSLSDTKLQAIPDTFFMKNTVFISIFTENISWYCLDVLVSVKSAIFTALFVIGVWSDLYNFAY